MTPPPKRNLSAKSLKALIIVVLIYSTPREKSILATPTIALDNHKLKLNISYRIQDGE